MSQQQLVDATNALFHFGSRPGEVSAAEAAEALTLACRALEATLEDIEMAQTLDNLSALGAISTSSDHAPVLADLARTFVRTEPELLLAVGLSEGAVRSLMEAGQELVASCMSTPLRVGELYASLHRLEHRLCGRADQITKTALDRRKRVKIRDTLTRGVVGVGGAAIVAVNVGAVAGAPVISIPLATMSSLFGGGLVNSALGTPWDKES